jgi:succinoglycan biosynthesis protein ExoM
MCEAVASVSVCITTCRRARGLKRLLNALEKQEFPKCSVSHIAIVVVDNDAARSAEGVYTSLGSGYRWPVEYCVEPRRGISYARNKAIDTVMQSVTEQLVFIDDDVVPEPTWLDELLFIQQKYDADMVFGPVVPYFDEPVPDWIVDGRFFERRRHASGSLAYGVTANVLFRTSMFREGNLRFDEKYALSGGEDAQLFARTHQKGYRAVWADEAIGYEWIPKSRANLRWLMLRSFRLGNVTSLKEMEMYPDLLSRFIRVSKGLGRVAQGVIALPFCAVYRKRALVKSLRRITYGSGVLAGQFGYRYREYLVVHGD